jgi:uncharacterized membrane protein YozB (DUF420 family)
VDLSGLPALNATLNATATVLLLWGRALVKRGRTQAHKRVMLSAFGVSSVFLASYVAHKVSRSFDNTTFNVTGAAKTAYLALLASHVVLAALVPFLALALIRFGLRGELARHQRLARIAWPIWLYVSITGVAIYALLYHLNPPPAP